MDKEDLIKIIKDRIDILESECKDKYLPERFIEENKYHIEFLETFLHALIY